MDGLKIVSAQEMARIEKRAIDRGCSEEKFMEEAGRKIAAAAMEFVESRRLPKVAALLVGKGNNGGDAYAAGVFLLEEGYRVKALPLYREEECSPLNQKFGEKFRKKGGRLEEEIGKVSLILDGYLGTGFKGKVEMPMAAAIHKANQSKIPILAIDIPSGLNGTSGEVGNCAIHAAMTVALGLPKMGFFLRQGWNCVGHLRVEDFGLPQDAIDEAKEMAYLPDWKKLELPKIVRTRNKYQAGFVVGFGGSKSLPGAPKMAALAALRAGAGIVKVFSSEEIGQAPLEVICQKWNGKEWSEALQKAGSAFVGPGLGKGKEVQKWLKKELKKIKKPCVVDADALQPNIPFPEMSILTPHRGEALRLLGLKEIREEEEFLAKLMKFCERNQVVLILKGGPTFVLAPGKTPVVVTQGDPGMASAGTGDVLTGIVAALLAQGMFCFDAAVLGATLHGLAGEAAAKEMGSYGLIATDLIHFLPKAIQAWIGRGSF